MKASQFLPAAAAAALLSTASAQTDPPMTVTAPARPFFIYDSHPTGSLEGSIVGYDQKDITYQLACPTANEACKKEGYYPVNITEHQESVWAGSNTATAGVTKFWRCDLGNGSDDVLTDQYGWCSVTTMSGGSTKVDEKTAVDSCFISARSVIGAITGGLDKVGYKSGEGYPASYYLSVLSEMSKTDTCAPFTSIALTGASATAAATGSAATGSGSTSLPAETGTASGSAAPSGSAPPSGSGRMSARTPLALGAVIAGIAAFL